MWEMPTSEIGFCGQNFHFLRHGAWPCHPSTAVAELEIAADRTLRRIETRDLTDRDSAALLAMLLKPLRPNAAMRKAVRRLRESEGG